MRGDERTQDGMFSYVSLEQRVPADHPLRAVRKLTDAVLATLSPEFDALYASSGRPSIAPEYILRALLLQVFYSVRSERLLVEQIDYNLLFRWFVGLGMDDAVWNHAVFSNNRDRLLTSGVAQRFFAEVTKQAKKFMSDEHFTVDGTLIQAWASQKSFRSRDGSDDDDGTDFRGQKRGNDTHQSTTDPDARPRRATARSRSWVILAMPWLGTATVDRRGDGDSCRWLCRARCCPVDAAEKQRGRARPITVGADKAYDRSSNLDSRTTRRPGFAISLSRRWLIEKGFGWLKQTDPLRQAKLPRLGKVDWLFVFCT
jgi:transposase